MKKKLALLLMVAMTLGQTPGYAFADEAAGNDSEAVAEENLAAAPEEEAAVAEEEAETAAVEEEAEEAAAEEEAEEAVAEEEAEEAVAEDDAEAAVVEEMTETAPVAEDRVDAKMSVDDDDDEDYESYEMSFFDDPYAHYYRDGEYTFSPDFVETSGRDYRLIYTVSTRDEGEQEWTEISSNGNEYSVSGEELTIYGENFKGEEDVEVLIDAAAVDAESGEFLTSDSLTFYLRKPHAEVENSTKVEATVNSSFPVPDEIELYIENAQHPDGDYIDCPRTGVEIESQSPKKPGETVIEIGEDFDEWGDIQTKCQGTAVLRVYYTDPDGEEKSYTIDVKVSEKIYNVDISCSKDSVVPGEKINLSASLDIWPEDEEDDGASDDKLEYRWSVDNDAARYVNLAVSKTDPSQAVLTINKTFDCNKLDGLSVYIEVGTTKDGAYEKLTDDVCWIGVSQSFCELYILQHDSSLLPGDSEEIQVVVRHYTTELAGDYEILDGVTFSWEDVNGIDIAQGSTSDTFIVTRNQIDFCEAYLRAEWTQENPVDPDEITHEVKTIWLYYNELNYQLDYYEDQNTFYSNETHTIDWYCADRDDLNISYQFKVGEEDWDSDDCFGTIYSADCYSVDGSTITLDGPALAAVGAEQIRIEAKGLYNGEVIASGAMSLELNMLEEEYTIDLPNVMEIGDDKWLYVEYNVKTSEDPFGAWGMCDVTDVKVTSQQTVDGTDADVVSLRKEIDEDEEPYFMLYGMSEGVAEVAVTFIDYFGQPRTETKKIFVVPYTCNVDVHSENNIYKTLPGGQISLAARCSYYNGNDMVTGGDYIYQWSFYDEDVDDECVTLTADASDPSKATVTFKALPDDFWGDSYNVTVKVVAGKLICGEFAALGYGSISLSEMKDFYDLCIDDHDPALGLGESETVNAQLRHYSTEFANGYEVISDVEYHWIDTEDYLDIEEKSKGSYKIRRMVGYETDFELEASWLEDGEEQTESHVIRFDDLGYDLEFNDYGYDDEYDAIMVPYDGDLTLEYTIKKFSEHPEIAIKTEVGRYDYDVEDDSEELILFTEGKDYDVDGQKVILHGASLRKITKGYFFVRLTADYEGYTAGWTWEWCHVDPMPVNKLNISVANAVYTGKKLSPKVTVKDGTQTLQKDMDYEVTFSNNVKVGTATATITGIGNYKGTVKKTFKISLAKPAISSVANVAGGVKVVWKKVTGAAKYRVFRRVYNTRTKKWSSWAKVGDTTALNYTDKTAKNGTKYAYTVRCISADGKKYTSAYYTTGKMLVYVLRPAISSLTSPKTKQMLVKWGKNAQATGYQIQYSTSSRFASGNKLVTIKGAKNVARTFSGLAAKKTYYVRIRTYKTVGGKNYYSAWSAVKNVKIK